MDQLVVPVVGPMDLKIQDFEGGGDDFGFKAREEGFIFVHICTSIGVH